MAALKKIASWLWPVIIERTKGEVTPVLEVAYENGKKVLNAGQVNYSYGSLHEIFRIILAKAKVKELKPSTALLLGFGAGSIASILTEEMKLNVKLTGVDADARVLELGRKEFNTGRFPGLELVHSTAEKYLAGTQEKFDLITVDVFVEAVVPPSCMTPEFIGELYAHLNEGGMVVFNEMPVDGGGEERPFVKNFRKVFTSAEITELRFGDAPNRILVGRKTV